MGGRAFLAKGESGRDFEAEGEPAGDEGDMGTQSDGNFAETGATFADGDKRGVIGGLDAHTAELEAAPANTAADKRADIGGEGKGWAETGAERIRGEVLGFGDMGACQAEGAWGQVEVMAGAMEVGIEAQVIAKEAPIDMDGDTWGGFEAGGAGRAIEGMGGEAGDKGEGGADIGMMLPGRGGCGLFGEGRGTFG